MNGKEAGYTQHISAQFNRELGELKNRLLTMGGLHHHLVRSGTRTKVSIILETGEARGMEGLPHGHRRSQGSVVYMLSLGDRDGDPLSGRFGFCDPRLPMCCRENAEIMSTPHFPQLRPGSMIIFPSKVVRRPPPLPRRESLRPSCAGWCCSARPSR